MLYDSRLNKFVQHDADAAEQRRPCYTENADTLPAAVRELTDEEEVLLNTPCLRRVK